MKKKVGNHPRNTAPMAASPRCGAKTRKGPPCRSPAVSGKKRCRMHGGAAGSGAPKGNQNALKHGAFTREMLEERREFSQMIREAKATLREIS
ncbi:hypothetical protein GCM10009069_05140 [Algimonas arctica]|uniref:Uncharacterized protein n=1 Tax=Algimonas arctica TaxID=1479486 RepID=A0A8J3CLR7_9PROT|nr:HGGxSTG domain-containing protein [Algimonas arctica]GHA84998.1 hypothetical protein GCM10009069_05140 [Algimonas arctica]